MSSVVYFVQADRGGPIKIGRASRVERRVLTLQAACPFELKLLATMPGGVPEERAFHRRFDSQRAHGEWFRPSRELCDLIVSLGGSPIQDDGDGGAPQDTGSSVPEPTAPGARLRALRTALGLHQQEIATVSGMDRVSITKMESGKNKVTSYRCRSGLARAFGLSTDEFAGFLDGHMSLRDARLRAVPLRPQES